MKKIRTESHYLYSTVSRQIKQFIPEVLSTLILLASAFGLAAQPGLEVSSPGNGIQVNSAGNNGVSVFGATLHGIGIFSAGDDGINIYNAVNDGFQITSAGSNGVYIEDANTHAIRIDDAGDDAIRINDAGDDGIDVHGAAGDGLYVTGAGRDGIFVNDVVGRYSMQIWGNKNQSATPIGHIAQIFNRSGGQSADVLALRVRLISDGGTVWPGAGNNFITFFTGDSVAIGRVEGNGSGGVIYGTSGADYAECMPIKDIKESFMPGDLVGVFGGKISHKTEGATQVMVITDQAAVLGNSSDRQKGYKPVSFIGQIPVRVRGAVQEGDWIVPDGNHRGIAKAVPTSELTPHHQIVGRAWEGSENPEIKRINTAVGLDHSEGLMRMILNQQKEIEKLRFMILELQKNTLNKTS